MKKLMIGFLALEICTFLFTTKNAFADEPNNIGEILKAKGIEWLLGNWETTTEKGEAVEAKFSLGMNNYMIVVEASVGEKKASGMIFYTKAKNTMVFSGADNQGGTLKGTCEVEDGKFVMNMELTAEDGKVIKFVRYLSKTDSDSMRCATFTLTEGKKPDQPTEVFEFKRKK